MLDMLDNLRRSRGSSSSDTDENGMIQQKEDKASPSKYIGPANLGHIAQVVSRNDKCGQTHSNENENIDKANVLKDPSINSKVYYKNKNTFSKK